MTDLARRLVPPWLIFGQKLGLYKALANGVRWMKKHWQRQQVRMFVNVRECFINQAAGGYVEYDKETKLYSRLLNKALPDG